MNREVPVEAPAELVRAPDIRTVDPRTEVERCARLLRWIEQLPAAAVVSSRQPMVADDLVSVVVPMFNASAWIETCLKGVLAQTHRNLEVFCVDDGSSDDTYDRVVDLFGRDGRLCAVKLARNVGPFQISNWAGGSLARGRRIAWQDADDVSHPTRIAVQSRWMARNHVRVSGACVHHFFPPDIAPYTRDGLPLDAGGLLHELVVFVTHTRQAAARDGDSADGWERAWQRNEIGPAGVAERGGDVPAFRYFRNSACLHGCQIIDTDLFRDFGGYPGVSGLGEDSDFHWRLTRFHDIGNLPHVLSSWRSHGASLTRRADTGLTAPARLRFRSAMHARQERITRELNGGRTQRARALCTESLHRGEIEIERAHCGFDVALS